MTAVLINLFHPHLNQSRANARLIEAANDLPGVTVRDHYALYPDGTIDVTAEQGLLEEHDVHIMQFPFYWFSSPPLFKAWQDQVLTYGGAFGDRQALKGKKWRIVTTLGGTKGDYSPHGLAGHEVDDILLPVKLTASYCGIEWLAPPCVYGVGAGGPNAHPDEGLDEAANQYRALLAG